MNSHIQYPHFTDQETELQRGRSDFPEVTEPEAAGPAWELQPVEAPGRRASISLRAGSSLSPTRGRW